MRAEESVTVPRWLFEVLEHYLTHWPHVVDRDDHAAGAYLDTPVGTLVLQNHLYISAGEPGPTLRLKNRLVRPDDGPA